jgi:enoyl-CoA hydratase/carnithine racemase
MSAATARSDWVQRRRDVVVVKVPPGVSLYGAEAQSFVQALVALHMELQKPAVVAQTKGVLVVQTDVADDATRGWLDELEQDGLLKDVAPRLGQLRWALAAVRHSPVPWAFFSASDCLGSVWELALSCHRRYWFAPNARLGFPDIEVGAFPPGGLLESLSRRFGKTRERWQSRPVFPAHDAEAEGLIHRCAAEERWEAEAEAVFRELLVNHAGALLPETPRRRLVPFNPNPPSHGDAAAYEQIAAVWRERSAEPTARPTAWDYCWQLVKERAKLEQPDDLGRLVSHIAARHYLSPEFCVWLASRVVQKLGQKSIAATITPRSARAPAVTVDLDYLAPPTECLVRLLRSGGGSRRLVFSAQEPKALAVGLNLVFARLERRLGGEAAYDLWHRQVAWNCGMVPEPDGVVLRFAVDDRLALDHGGRTYTVLRLEGNAGAAAPGVVEWVEGDDLGPSSAPMAVRQVLGDVADAWISTNRAAAGGAPLTVLARSLFFEELLTLAAQTGGDVTVPAEALKKCGWRFAADEESWDRFLKTRADAYVFDREAFGLGPSVVSRSHWEIGSWKHARVVARREASGAAARKWNAVALSQHLASFAAMMASAFVRDGRLRGDDGTGEAARAAGDALCAVALGFPADYGTPLTWAERRGSGRIERHVARFWPRLVERASKPACPEVAASSAAPDVARERTDTESKGEDDGAGDRA